MSVSQGFFSEMILCPVREVDVPGHRGFDFSTVSCSLFDVYAGSKKGYDRIVRLHPRMKNYQFVMPRIIKPTVLRVDEIEQPIRSFDLFQRFGINCCVEIAHIVDLIEGEQKKTSGVLLTTGLANFMFVNTTHGVVLINLVCTGSNWCMGCHSLEGDYVCPEGRRVIYHM